MQNDDIISPIRAMKEAIEAARASELERHATAMTAFEIKLREIAIAERVFSEAMGSVPTTDTPPASDKPSDLPTMPDMIKAVLGEAKRPLEPNAIKDRVCAKYWSGFKSTDVGPAAWRMWKRGELDKVDGMYWLPAEIEFENFDKSEDDVFD